MKKSAQYLKIVEWSQEDGCYVGRCPELMLGGVHGENEQKVFAELCTVIEEWIEISEKDNEPLPPGWPASHLERILRETRPSNQIDSSGRLD